MNPDHAWIAAHIPHQGTMCLLDRVEQWDSGSIVCRASSHRAADNPLRAADRLGIAAGIEYAAQAMAVHGALLGGDESAPEVGYLTSVRDVSWLRRCLDDIGEDLVVSAERISGNDVTVLYSFSIAGGGSVLLSGRASVMLKVVAA